jgi:DNA replication protein DnaC
MNKDTDTLINGIGNDAAFLKLDISATEIADFAVKNNLSYDNIYYISQLFDAMVARKKEHTVEMMLKLSRLPTVHPYTFDNFDFSRFHGRQADELENLQTLSALQARMNLLLVGPQGIGKTHLSMAFGRKCCEEGYKTYFLKASEMNDKFTSALRQNKRDKVIQSLVKPACLIIDEFGYCNFNQENTRMFFDVVDRRYSKDSPNTMILTSNIEPDKWVQYFADEMPLKSAMDRFFDKCLVINMHGNSYRGGCRRKIDVTVGKASPDGESE